MPIKPENRKRYPANWKDIRKDILKRADNKCEFCGIENYTIRENGSKVVLTIAHLDHTPENCDYSNLRALCQRCHKPYKEDTTMAHLFKQEQQKPPYNPKDGNGGGTSNPFAKDTFNLTEQGRLLKENPAQAKEMAALAGVTL